VKDLDNLFLSHAHRPGNRLVHEGTRPPRAHEDDPCKLLEIQTHPSRLELNQQDLATVFFGPRKHLAALCAVQAAMIQLTARVQELGQELHLLMKGAEDDELVFGLFRHKLFEGIHLGRGLRPALIQELGAHRGLLQAQEDGQGELVIPHLIGKVVFALEPLELVIEGLFPLVLEVNDALLNDGDRRTGGQDRSHLLHGSVDTHFRDEGLVVSGDPGHGVGGGDTEEREQGDSILLRVDNGRARDGPLNGNLLGEAHEQLGLLALKRPNGMGLIQDQAVPGLIQELVEAQDGLVIGDVDFGAFLHVRVQFVPVVGAFDKDTEAAFEGVVRPVVNESHGTQEERLGLGIRLHGGQDLDGLAEAHVVALETAIDLAGSDGLAEDRELGPDRFKGQHLLDAGHLVFKVGQAGPEGLDLLLFQWKGSTHFEEWI